MIYTLTYAFCLLVCFGCGFPFCNDHQFIDVSRCGNP